MYYNPPCPTASKWLHRGLNAGWLALKSALWTVGFAGSARTLYNAFQHCCVSLGKQGLTGG